MPNIEDDSETDFYDESKRAVTADIEKIGKFHPMLSSFRLQFDKGSREDMLYLAEALLKRITVALPRLRDLTIFGETRAGGDLVSCSSDT
jgi:hypothetical protein